MTLRYEIQYIGCEPQWIQPSSYKFGGYIQKVMWCFSSFIPSTMHGICIFLVFSLFTWHVLSFYVLSYVYQYFFYFAFTYSRTISGRVSYYLELFTCRWRVHNIFYLSYFLLWSFVLYTYWIKMEPYSSLPCLLAQILARVAHAEVENVLLIGDIWVTGLF